ncbi:hypothetical protein XO12_10175 [Marinitoga sp. 1154]|uniref:carbohydrate kinase family protein n=1 Tax=Marinitoga sp. 1154 TaxID=1643335 RepID=UPI00158651DC|nr:PfkB family carbohydrate kinase [Marinitoga sp. 1154]NUV00438.1 hypothetical protein [Marinitoga sp. 1154]
MFLSIGEVLIDMISEFDSLENANVFRKFFGGSPGNIAVNLARQNIESYILSTIGRDQFGLFIKNYLKKKGVNTSFLFEKEDVNTDIVFVNKSKKTPEFKAYQSSSINLEIPDIDLSNFKIIHISSWAISETTQFEKILQLVKKAKSKNIIIGFDPNYRTVLWHNKYSIIEVLKIFGPYIDIIKPSLDDAENIFGNANIDNFKKLGIKNIIFTLGEKGAIIYNKNYNISLSSYKTNVIDVTGAGDAVWSGIYIGLINNLNIVESVKLGLAFAAEKLKYTGAIAPLDNWKNIKNKYVR